MDSNKKGDFKNCRLTPREKEIIILFAQGYTAKEVAQHLYLSHYTVLSHKKRIFQKLGIRKIVHIGVYAERRGFLKNRALYL